MFEIVDKRVTIIPSDGEIDYDFFEQEVNSHAEFMDAFFKKYNIVHSGLTNIYGYAVTAARYSHLVVTNVDNFYQIYIPTILNEAQRDTLIKLSELISNNELFVELACIEENDEVSFPYDSVLDRKNKLRDTVILNDEISKRYKGGKKR